MKKLDKYEILSNKNIQVREIEVLELKDGRTIDGGYHRFVLTPGTKLKDIPYEEIKAIAKVLWTKEVVKAFKDSQKDE